MGELADLNLLLKQIEHALVSINRDMTLIDQHESGQKRLADPQVVEDRIDRSFEDLSKLSDMLNISNRRS